MPLKISLHGYGLWGRNILRELRALGHSVTVVEPRAEAREAALQAGAARVVADTAESIESDADIVATPASTHAALIERLLETDRPILTEKPFTTDAASARRLAAVGEGRLFVGHIWCYHPGVEMLAAIARSGELGPVHGLRTTRANWSSPRTDVDSSWNLAPHDLSLALFVLGAIPEPRAALAERVDGRCVGLTCLLGGAPWLVFEVSNRYADKRREVRLHARDGVAVLPDADSGYVEILRAGDDGAARIERRAYEPGSALRRELAAFCAFVQGGPPPKSSAADGLAVVEALERLRGLAGLAD